MTCAWSTTSCRSIPPVRGLVTEVPIEPNRPIKKGDVLFKIDPVPFEIAVTNCEAQLGPAAGATGHGRSQLAQPG